MPGLIFFVTLLMLFLYTVFKFYQLLPKQLMLSFMSALFIMLAMILPIFLMRSQLFINEVFYWFGMLIMSCWVSFIILTLPIDLLLIINLIFKLTHHLQNYSFLYKIGLIIAFFISGLGLYQAINGPRLVEVTIPINHLSPDLNNFRIAQISDLHVGPMLKTNYVKKVVDLINNAAPDLIVFTGDFADGQASELIAETQPLANLQAPAGKFYITGNHEYYWGINAWIKRAQQLGFYPLLNTSQVIKWRNAQILITGIDNYGDQLIHQQNIAAALNNLDITLANLRIFLNHRPLDFQEIEKYGFHLQISGHTHGGQFLPWGWFVNLAYQYSYGLNRYKNLWIYVSRGTGYWGPPNRFLLPAEVTLITLKRFD